MGLILAIKRQNICKLFRTDNYKIKSQRRGGDKDDQLTGMGCGSFM